MDGGTVASKCSGTKRERKTISSVSGPCELSLIDGWWREWLEFATHEHKVPETDAVAQHLIKVLARYPIPPRTLCDAGLKKGTSEEDCDEDD